MISRAFALHELNCLILQCPAGQFMTEGQFMHVSAIHADGNSLSNPRVRDTTDSTCPVKGNIYSVKGYMLLLRRGRDTIRIKRGQFSPNGEPTVRQDSTRLCAQAPTSGLVFRSPFVLLTGKTNHAFNVPRQRKHIVTFYLIRGIAQVLHSSHVSGKSCWVAGDIDDPFR